MSRKNLMLAMAGAIMAMASDPFIRGRRYSEPRDKKPKTREELDFYMSTHMTHDHRQLREFSIKGHKIMAYSKKDAIPRLKHLKKI